MLCRIEEAAADLGIPAASLRNAAEAHGFIVRMGRAVRIERNRLPELIKKCRDQPKEQGSTSTSTAPSGTSSIPDAGQGQRAAQAAQRLKKPSQPTSPQKGGTVLPMSRPT